MVLACNGLIVSDYLCKQPKIIIEDAYESFQQLITK